MLGMKKLTATGHKKRTLSEKLTSVLDIRESKNEEKYKKEKENALSG